MNKRRGAQLLLTALLAAPLVVCMPLAATAAEAPPGAGSILQQIQPANPPRRHPTAPDYRSNKRAQPICRRVRLFW